MTEKLAKIEGMLRSGDIEMVRLGIFAALTTCDYDECQEIIPFYQNYPLYDKVPVIEINEKNLQMTRYGWITRYTENMNQIFIKDDIAIAIVNNRVFVRSLGIMRLLINFDKIPKTYFN